MALPSFSCNLSWCFQILAGVLKFHSIFVYPEWSWGFKPWWESLERIRVKGYWIGSYSCAVLRRLGRRGDEAETAEVPLKPGKDPTESFLKPMKVSGIQVETPSCD